MAPLTQAKFTFRTAIVLNVSRFNDIYPFVILCSWVRILYCYMLINIHLLDSWEVEKRNVEVKKKRKPKTIMYLGSERSSSSRIIFLAVGYLYFHFVEMIDESACVHHKLARYENRKLVMQE